MADDQISISAAEAIKEMRALSKEANGFLQLLRPMESALEEVANGMALTASNSRKMVTSQQAANNAIREVTAALRNNTRERGAALKTNESLARSVERMVDQVVKERGAISGLASTMQGYTQRLDRLETQLIAASSAQMRFNSATRAADTPMKGLGRSMNLTAQGAAVFREGMQGAGLGIGFMSAQTIIASASAYAFGKALRATIAAGVEFEKQFTTMALAMQEAETITSGSFSAMADDVKSIRYEILSLATSTEHSLKAVTKGAEVLARSGQSSADIMQNLGKVLNLATVGSLELEDAANIATSALAAFGEGSDQLGRYVDILAVAANKSKASVEDLGLALKYTGPVAHELGLSAEELTTAIGTLSNAGIRSVQAGTSIRRLLVSLLDPTDKARAVMDKYGVSLDEAAIRSGKFAQELAKLNAASLEEQKALTYITALPATLALINASATGAFGTLETAIRNATGYTEEFTKVLRETTSVKFDNLVDTISATLIGAFSEFGPRLNEMISEADTWVTDNSGKIAQTVGELVNGFLTLVEVVRDWSGVLTTALRVFVEFKVAQVALRGIAAGFTAATSAAKSFKAAAVSASVWGEITSGSIAARKGIQGAAGAMGTLAVAGRGLTAALGGPVGAFIMLGSIALPLAYEMFGRTRREIESLPVVLATTANSVEDLTTKLRAMNEARREQEVRGAGNILEFGPAQKASYEALEKVQETELKNLRKRKAELENLIPVLEKEAKAARDRAIILNGSDSAARAYARASGALRSAQEQLSSTNEDGIAKARELAETQAKLADVNAALGNATALLSENQKIQGEMAGQAADKLYQQAQALDAVASKVTEQLGPWRVLLDLLAEGLRLFSQFTGIGKGLSGMPGFLQTVLAQGRAAIPSAGSAADPRASAERLLGLTDVGELTDPLDRALHLERLQKAMSGLRAAASAGIAPNSEYDQALKSVGLSANEVFLKLEMAIKGLVGTSGTMGGASKAADELTSMLTKQRGTLEQTIDSLRGIQTQMERVGSGKANAALKEMGISAEQAAESLSQMGRDNALAYIGAELTKLDPRFKDFGKTVATVGTSSLTTAQAQDKLREILTQLEAQAPGALAFFGGMEAAMAELGTASDQTTSGLTSLVQRVNTLVEEGDKMFAAMNSAQTFDEMVAALKGTAFALDETKQASLALALGGDALKAAMTETLTPTQRLAELTQLLDKAMLGKGVDAKTKAIEKLGRAVKGSAAWYRNQIGLINAETAAYLQGAQAARAFAVAKEQLGEGATPGEVTDLAGSKEFGELVEGMHKAERQAERIKSIFDGIFAETGIKELRSDVKLLGDALAKLGKEDEGYTEAALAHARAVVEARQAEFDRVNLVIGSMAALTSAVGTLFSENEKGQKKAAQLAAVLAVAEQAAMVPVLVAKASEAILTQAAKGDPYSAFARMAIMAGAVAPLLSAVGAALPAFGGGGGGTNSAAYRQERQGTGTVLGDETAKSESILNAVEITADATEQLVGINRGMLNALNAMVAGISGASTLLARGAGDIDVGPLNTGGSFLGINLGNIFGGKESLRDQGIRIAGGTLSEMLNEIVVQAYASIHRSGGWFRSSRDYDRFTTLGDDVAAQFSLVLGSMADAVRAAADALGMDMDEVNARIASFQIEEIRISTMDLSAEEAQKELEAAFSAIFDGLAGHVVPFIDQFQKVGEGLAETLIRVATGVQVTQEAMIQLGFSLDETDPEKFARASEALMDLAGGVDAFIDGMSSFVSNFATEEHKFAVAQDALTRAFAQAGIEIPATRDAMWELMQAQDATTESGREVIAMLLRLAGVSDSYYDALEDRAAAMAGIDADIAAGAWEQYLDGLEEGQRAIVELTRYYDDWIASATAAGATAEHLTAIEEQRAVAMGRLLEAAEADYQRMLRELSDEIDAASMTEYTAAMREINRWTAKTTDELNAAARAAGRQSAAEGDLARVHQVAALRAAQALARLQEQAQALADELYGTPLSRLDDQIAALQEAESAASSAIGGFSGALTDAANAAAEAMGLLLGSYSPLRAVDKLPIAMDALRRGETDANTVLQIARDVYGSGRAYNDIFYEVQRIAAQNAANANQGGGGNTVVAGEDTVSREMQALIAERDALLAAQTERDRFLQASQLAGMVADLSGARGESFGEIAELLGFTLEQLAEDLRLSGAEDAEQYLQQLQEDQRSLAELFDTPTAGDLVIVDAIRDLTALMVEEGRMGDWPGDTVPGVAEDGPGATTPAPVTAPIAVQRTEQDDQLVEDTREMVLLLRELRELVTRVIPAGEDTATATERVAEGVERLAEILESDGGPADAANRRRGG